MGIGRIKAKLSQLPLPAKAAMWFTGCNIFVRGISFLSAPIFTRFLSDSEYGLLSLYMSVEGILLVFACWDVPYGAYQKGIFKYEDDLPFFKSTIQLFTTITSFAFFTVLVAAYPLLKEIIIIPRQFLWLVMVYGFFQTAYRNWLVSQQCQYAYRMAVSMTALYSLLSVAVPLCAIIFFKATADVKFGSQMLLSVVFYSFFYFPHMRYGRLFKDFDKFKKQIGFIIRFQLPCVFHSLSLLILSQADRIMIGNMVGTAQAAYYSVAYSLASAIQVIISSLSQVLQPWTFHMMTEKKYGQIRKYISLILIFLAGMLLLFIMIAPELIDLLFPESYHEAVACIPPITMSLFFTFLYGNFTCIQAFFEKTQYLMIVSLICGGINIGLNYICIGIFGYVACAYTTLFSYLLFAVGHYSIMTVICRKNGIQHLFSGSFLAVFSLLFLAVGMGLQLLYLNRFLRYAVFAFGLLCTFAFRKEIIELLKNVRRLKKTD